ncbi:MAG: HEAT repeat domain-containing protein [Cyanobacteria bacterium P01_A01_bin.83]
MSWLLVFLLAFVFTVSWGHAQDDQLVPPQSWQLKGILAALDDSDPKIWVLALEELSEYKVDELEIPEDKYQPIVELLDYKKNSLVQYAAAEALGQMKAKEYAAEIVPLLSSDDSLVQRAAAYALKQFGIANKETILTILNNIKCSLWKSKFSIRISLYSLLS